MSSSDLTPLLQQLFYQLNLHQPQSVILASQNPFPELAEHLQNKQCALTHVSIHNELGSLPLPKAAFGIVIDYLEHLDKDFALQQIAYLRNCHCKQIWLVVDAQLEQWTFSDFIALGFKRTEQIKYSNIKPESTLQCYGYDLNHYIRKRDWNNPRFWANPEQWGKRW